MHARYVVSTTNRDRELGYAQEEEELRNKRAEKLEVLSLTNKLSLFRVCKVVLPRLHTRFGALKFWFSKSF